MKYLRLFETESQYETAKVRFEYPTVSYTEDASIVHYMTLREKYTKEYLTFKALEDGTFTLSIPSSVNSTYMTSVSYSTDNGKTWTDIVINNKKQTITTPTINAGDKVLWKGVGTSMTYANATTGNSNFTATCNFNAVGNIMSMLYGDNFINQTTIPSTITNNFGGLFKNNSHLISVENLILPATTLAQSCYKEMFSGCTSITTIPELPATTMTSMCYCNMFYGCTSLTTIPILPATSLNYMCYGGMFNGCTALTTVPSNMLPATTVANSSYKEMFKNCTSLTTAPLLDATTINVACYDSMFYGCTSLTTAPTLPATTLANGCYKGMFWGCTALTTAPTRLPATSTVKECYKEMFNGCTSLTTAPELPAKSLNQNCYSYMFDNCSSLNYIKAMFTTTPSTSYTYNWVNGVTATGTFVKNSAATWNVTGDNGVPKGWTVETASE